MPSPAVQVAMVKIGLILGGLMTAAAYLVLLERWMAAWVQDRLGPNRVGVPLTRIRLFGLGQPLADGLKFIFKEEYTPGHVDRWLYVLAPLSILAAALAAFAVVPFGGVLPAMGGTEATAEPIELIVAPGVDVGLIYIFALSGIAVYGVLLGGWASNNKYSFLGGLRSSAQLIAYELPLGVGILGVVLASHSLRLEDIIQRQADSGLWFAFVQPLGFVVFVVAAFAESGRLPFDLPEAEQELIGGYHTEYAGLKLLFFLVAEFLHMILAAYLIAILFLGGWHLWGVTTAENLTTWGGAIARVVILQAKVFGVILFFMLVRWSWPRFRYDQLMSLAWKVMLPLGMVNLAAVAVIEELRHPDGPGKLLVERLGAWADPAAIAVAWGVCILAWLVVAVAGPLVTDNTPRRDLAGRGSESMP
jgi:NADH-quinone oxidoreductase subunit H